MRYLRQIPEAGLYVLKTRDAIGAAGGVVEGVSGVDVDGLADLRAADFARLCFAVGVVVGKWYFVVMRCFFGSLLVWFWGGWFVGGERSWIVGAACCVLGGGIEGLVWPYRVWVRFEEESRLLQEGLGGWEVGHGGGEDQSLAFAVVGVGVFECGRGRSVIDARTIDSRNSLAYGEMGTEFGDWSISVAWRGRRAGWL